MYQLIIFDWDGTLMDSAAKISNCMRAAAIDVGVDVPSIEAAKNVIGLGLTEAITILFPAANRGQLSALSDAYRYQFLEADDTEQALFDGVKEGLQQLGIKKYFTVSRCADETRSKPHPQMLHEILDFTAIDASKAIMVGDTSFDMEMAHGANIDGLGVAYGVHSVDVLKKSGAIEIRHDFRALLSWLLDQRVEKAFS